MIKIENDMRISSENAKKYFSKENYFTKNKKTVGISYSDTKDIAEILNRLDISSQQKQEFMKSEIMIIVDTNDSNVIDICDSQGNILLEVR